MNRRSRGRHPQNALSQPGGFIPGLIRNTLRQGVLVNIIFVMLAGLAAFWAIPNLAIERYPNIAFGEVRVTTAYPGADPEEVERLVTDVIEESLRGMEDLEFVKSTSIANQSGLHVKFIDDTDYDTLYEELRLRVLGVQNRLPTVNGDPLTPQFSIVEVDEWLPVIQVSLVSTDETRPWDESSLVLLGKDLRQRLELIPGVKKVLVLGDVARQYVVALDPAALQRHGTTLSDVAAALRRSGGAPPAGLLTTSAGERLIKVDQRYRSPEDIRRTVVRLDGSGNVLRVADLMDLASSGVQRPEGTVISTINGRDAVTCKVLKLAEANAIDVKDAVVQETDIFLANHQGENIDAVYTLDGTVQIHDGLGVLVDCLLLSAVLVMALLFLFLDRRHGLRMLIGLGLGVAAAIAVVVLPNIGTKLIAIGILSAFVLGTCRAAVLTVSGIVFSFLVALLIFYICGWSVSEISLLGLVLVSGIVVDDAIVVLENIQRHREEGKDLIPAVIDGTTEVFMPVTSATLTTLAAFLPMLLMTGAIGEFFSLVPIAVSTALFVSLIECLLILPLHVVDSERVLGRDPNVIRHDESGADSGLVAWIGRRYDRLLSWNLHHPTLVLSSVGLLFLLAVGILVYSMMAPLWHMTPLVKNKFFPDDTSIVDIRVEMPVGTPLAETDDLTRRLARQIDSLGPGWSASVSALVGLSLDEAYRPVFGNQYAMLNVETPAKEQRAFDDPKELIRRVRDVVAELTADVPGRFEAEARQGGPPVGPPVNIRLTGIDDDDVLAMTTELLAFLRAEADGGRLQGLYNLTHDRTRTTTVLTFQPDRERIAVHGLSDAQVQQAVADAIDGAYVGEFRRIDNDIPVRARLARHGLADPLQLVDVPLIDDPSGRSLRFDDLGSLTVERMPASLIRRDFQRTVTITGKLYDDALVDANSIIPVVREWLAEHGVEHPGVAVAFGGEAESTLKSYRSLALAFIIALVLIYAILAGQFRSYLQPTIIMSNIVFSFTGVVFALSVFGVLALMVPGLVAVERSYFTVQVFIAIVGLTGLVVNDAIVMIDFINRRRREGADLDQALLIAGRQRMRPILMTTATTIAGLLPMAVGIPDFSITWGPFATSFIVGLLFSTSMTLLVLPVLYRVVDRLGTTLSGLLTALLPADRARISLEEL